MIGEASSVVTPAAFIFTLPAVHEPLPSRDFLCGGNRMSEENAKTPLDHVNATVTQLKEMHHYAKNNVELLTTQWLMFDGELSKLKRAEKIEQLMTLQGQFYDALEAAITDLEELAVELQPPPPEE